MLQPPAAQFPDIFPFHVVVDGAGCLVQAGKAIVSHLPQDWCGAALETIVNIERPAGVRIGLDTLCDVGGKLWVLVLPNGLRLRGCWRVSESHGFFLGSPWATDLEALQRLGIGLRDFPGHDPVGDHLMLVQHHRMGLDDMRRMAERYRSARDAAEAASAAKTRFLAAMSHEIRTPMNGVIGMTDALGDTHLDGEQRRLVDTIARSADHLLHVINDILDFSRMEAGGLPLDLAAVALEAHLQAVLDVVAPTAADKQVALALEVDPTLPARISADPVRLTQVLLNLVGNAVKFMAGAGTVTLAAQRDPSNAAGERLVLAVQDTGVGMSPDALARVFEPFTQAEAGLRRGVEGSGLGLAIARQLVELMGGHIRAESVPGVGSTFIVDIPLVPVAEQPAEGSRAPDRPTLAGRVLVVEDNAINRRVADAMLRRAGLEVIEVHDGQQALDVLLDPSAAAGIDLVLMDCHMPVLDGIEATQRLRAAGCTLPVLALTANVMDSTHAACRAAGMDAVLTKPLARDVLHAALAEHLDRPT